MSSLRFQRAPIRLQQPYFKHQLQLFNPEQKLNIKFHIEQNKNNSIQIFPQTGVIFPNRKLLITVSYSILNRNQSRDISVSLVLITQFSNQVYDLSSGQKKNALKYVSINTQRRIKCQQTCFIIPIIVSLRKDPLKSNVSLVGSEKQKLYQQFDEISAIFDIQQNQKLNDSFVVTQKKSKKSSNYQILRDTRKTVSKRIEFQNNNRQIQNKLLRRQSLEQYKNKKKQQYFLNRSLDFQDRQTSQEPSTVSRIKQVQQKLQLNFKGQTFRNHQNVEKQNVIPLRIEKLQFQKSQFQKKSVSNTQRLMQALKTVRFEDHQKNIEIIVLAVIAGIFFALGANLATMIK